MGEPRGALVPDQGLLAMTVLLLEVLRANPSWAALGSSQTFLESVPPQMGYWHRSKGVKSLGFLGGEPGVEL